MRVKKRAIVFTDLDGTLLDEEDYSFEPALNSIELLKTKSIPIVFCSSKTRGEIEYYRKKLRIYDPFIVENGGAIFIPQDYFTQTYNFDISKNGYNIIKLGLDYPKIIRKLKQLKKRLDIDITCLSDLSPQEISKITGLNIEEATASKQREYDEPFLLNNLDSRQKQFFFEEIQKSNLQLTKGNIFYHLHGNSNKGEAVRKLMNIYRQTQGKIISIALGDSPNDLPMLQSVDKPILLRKKDLSYNKEIKEQVPGLYIASEAGPAGWNRAILDWLTEQ